MEKYIVISSILILLVLLVVLIKHYLKPQKISFTSSNDTLFTAQERDFYGILCQASAGRAIVLGKVCILDLPASKQGQTKLNRAYKKMANKRFDYILCDPKTFAVLAIVDFEESADLSKSQQKENKATATVCAAVDITYLSIRLEARYDVVQVEKRLFSEA
jgi:hypothetical protein